MTDYTELKRLAEAHAQKDIVDPVESKRVMLVEPKTVLALIAENERNQRMVLSACMSMGAIGESLGLDMDSDGDEMLGMVAELKAERDRLRAEVAGLKTGYEAYERVNAELKAENEALRKHAERYQWLRDSECAGRILRDMGAKVCRHADQRIDAAMGKGEQS